ncbi:MAG: hypothetical protein OEQ12_03085 [Nitrosopumilus sp.]|nr:hypothetical protein [Nitrosopumilus sp.]
MKFILSGLFSLMLLMTLIPAISFSSADSTVPLAKSNSDISFTAGTFADKYKNLVFTGNRVPVMIKVVGESENADPTKRAKEIRYLQNPVLKFLSFSNAVNVVSDKQKNEIITQIDAAWIPILEQRSDVISVTLLEIQNDDKWHTENLSPKKQFKNSILFYDVKCNSGLQLTQRYDGSPACVKPETVYKLIQRGWVSEIIKVIQSRIISSEIEHTSSYMKKIVPTLDDFKNTLYESQDIDSIFFKFGNPHDDIGSGIHIYVYNLNDATQIWMGYADRILYMYHIDSDGNILEKLFVENEN